MSSPVKAVERYGVLLCPRGTWEWVANKLERFWKKAKRLN
jgi:hypothetical protein